MSRSGFVDAGGPDVYDALAVGEIGEILRTVRTSLDGEGGRTHVALFVSPL